jgi:hypothetical protein
LDCAPSAQHRRRLRIELPAPGIRRPCAETLDKQGTQGFAVAIPLCRAGEAWVFGQLRHVERFAQLAKLAVVTSNDDQVFVGGR